MESGIRDIEIVSDDLATGIEELLSRTAVSGVIANGASYMLGIDAEAETLSATIRDAIEVIGALANEHHALIADCELSGIRKTDNGYRLWGVIECVPGTPAKSTRVDQVDAEELGNGRWRYRMRGEVL